MAEIEAKIKEFNENQRKILELLLRDPGFIAKNEAKKLSTSPKNFGTLLTSVYKALEVPTDYPHMKKRKWVYDKYHADYDYLFNRKEWDKKHPQEIAPLTTLNPSKEPPRPPLPPPQTVETPVTPPVANAEIFIKPLNPRAVTPPSQQIPIPTSEPTPSKLYQYYSSRPSSIGYRPRVSHNDSGLSDVDPGCTVTLIIIIVVIVLWVLLVGRY